MGNYQMTFEQALALMKKGKSVKRENEIYNYETLDEASPICSDGSILVWQDLIAEDWEISE